MQIHQRGTACRLHGAAHGVQGCPRRFKVVRAAGSDEPSPSSCPFAKFIDPPQTQRSLLEQLNLSADTYDTQHAILNGSPAARAPYMFVDTVLVGTADLAKEVFTNDSGAFDIDFPPHMLDILGRNSMGTVNEPEHMQIRKLFAPGFTGAEVERYLPRVQRIAERFCAAWAASGAVPSWQEEIKLFTFEVICSVVAGIDWDDAELREMSGLFAKVTAALGFPITLPIPFTPYSQGKAARQQIIARLQPQIDKYCAAVAAGTDAAGSNGSSSSADASKGSAAAAAAGERRPCILERWVAARDEHGVGLTDEQLHDNLIGLLVAGHDTTSSTLSIVLSYLDRYPEVQERVRQEQQQLADKYGSSITPAAMQEMEYTEAAVREVWRMHPVVPIVGRKVGPQPTTLGPFKLAPGQSTWLGLNHILKSDPRWEGAVGEFAPDRFAPERFLTAAGREQGSQLVFGGGARSCLGERLAWADLKVMLAVLMRGYEYRLAGPAEIAGFPFPVAKMECSSFRAL